MIAFKTMWNDVTSMLSENKLDGIEITENFKTGFIVNDNGNSTFITRDDFVDFWCRMLCNKQISESEIKSDEKSKMQYVYDVVKKLPYVRESEGTLKLME